MTANIIDSEEWRDIPGYEGYQASSLGRIRSKDRTHRQRMPRGGYADITYPGKVRLQSQCPKTRYMKIGLSFNGKPKTFSVHTLVCKAFHGDRPGRNDVAHGNGDRTDNLRWCTRSENLMDRVKHGTSNRGERNRQSKLTDEQARDIKRRLKQGERQYILANEYGVSQSAIHDIKNGRRHVYLE